MARLDLNHITRVDKQRNTVHDKVAATYTVFKADDETFVQIDTYGRAERAIPEKISQSIQLDKESAKYLVNILRDEFEL